MSTEREPWEIEANLADEHHVQAVLDEVLEDYASWRLAEEHDLDADACERWLNKVWDTLRDSLDGEQRLHAILLLLAEQSHDRAEEISRSVSDAR